MSYLQAIVIAVVQGVTELFPVSSLGHSVLVPAWIGGNWHTLVTQSAQANSSHSFYLAFIVALHCATALALLWFFRLDWIRIIRGVLRTIVRALREHRYAIEGRDERLGWMILIATIPVGLLGVALEQVFRTAFAKPEAAAILLTLNGLVLIAGERFARQDPRHMRQQHRQDLHNAAQPRSPTSTVRVGGRTVEAIRAARASDARISHLSMKDAVIVGSLQIFALFAGVSRSGITIVGGLVRGLDHEDAARFGFLLATPPILAAGVLKIPSLAGPAGAHIHGQVIVGAIITAVSAYLSVRFLVTYFTTRTLRPFALYCIVFGLASVFRFA